MAGFIFDETVNDIKYRWIIEREKKKSIRCNTIPELSMLFCRQCFLFDCQMHSSYSLIQVAVKQNKDNKRLPSNCSNRGPCGPFCYKTNQKAVPTDWTDIQLYLLRKTVQGFEFNYCNIAYTVGKYCNEVYRVLEERRHKLPQLDLTFSHPWDFSSQRANKLTLLNSNNYNEHKMYAPCYHPGLKCSLENRCECAMDKSFCEKFCYCEDDCDSRYKGCSCKGKCDGKNCSCAYGMRECDRDVCGCGDECVNNQIQKGLKKHILIGKSQIAGLGAYSFGSIKQDELIAEYKGEIISQEEAERRGLFYDKAGISFLFDANRDYVVDSTFKGNKIRFANHSRQPNCYAKTLFVLGDHRIGIYAKRDIEAGEELLFDYGYQKEHASKYIAKDLDMNCQ